MSLVAVYRLDETAQADRLDQLAAGPALAASPSTLHAAALLGNGLTGVANIVEKTGGIGALGALRSGNWTIAFWVKRTAASYGWTLEWMKGSTTDGFIAGDGNASGSYGAIQYSGGSGFVDASPVTFPSLNTWRFYAYSWDLAAKRLRGYTNAVQHTTAADAGASLPADWDKLSITFGNAVILDQMMFYNEILTPTTGTNSLNQLYNSGAGYDPTAVVATTRRRHDRRRLLRG